MVEWFFVSAPSTALGTWRRFLGTGTPELPNDTGTKTIPGKEAEVVFCSLYSLPLNSGNFVKRSGIILGKRKWAWGIITAMRLIGED